MYNSSYYLVKAIDSTQNFTQLFPVTSLGHETSRVHTLCLSEVMRIRPVKRPDDWVSILW
jgi:hypothetical protein